MRGETDGDYSEAVRDLPPASLFKYRALHRPRFDRDRDIILKHRLWAGSPLAFNDPFDCFPRVDTSGTEREKSRWAQKAAGRHFYGKPRAERRRFAKRIRDGLRRTTGNPNADRGASNAWKDYLKDIGVIAFAERPDDLLMWGYYADSHQGYCLEFATNDMPLVLANRVLYSEERPVFRVFDPDRKELMERLLLKKAAVWEHEREWRIARADAVGPMEFPAPALRSIILGANVRANDEAALRKICAERPNDVALKRAVLDAQSFKLVIVDA